MNSQFQTGRLQKRKRIQLTVEIKIAVCKLKVKYPNLTFPELQKKIKDTFKVDVGLTTVKDIIKNSNFYLCKDSNSCTKDAARKTLKSAKYTQLEDALFLWLNYQNSQNIAVNDAALVEKARNLGEYMKLTEFQYSSGWLYNFKKRFSIKSYKLNGEAGSIGETTVCMLRTSISKSLAGYDPNDIFNLDESGLFMEMGPNRTLATCPQSGKKVSKKRITIVLCTNANGTYKFPLFVIGKSKRPRCFKGFNVNNYVCYYSNKKGWMNSIIFFEIVNFINEKMIAENRKILLILDNAPSHKIVSNLSNVKITFLPPNTTAHLQPLDMGIIRSLKAKYKRQIVMQQLKTIENGQNFQISIKDSILFLYRCWHDISATTISNCFKKSGIVNGNIENEIDNPIEDLEETFRTNSIDVNIEDLINDKEEDITEEMLNDDVILNVVVNDDVSSEESESENNLQERVLVSDALNSVEILQNYLVQENNSPQKGFRELKGLHSELQKLKNYLSTRKRENLVQTKIVDFYNK